MPAPASTAIIDRALRRHPLPGESVELPVDLAVLGGAAGPETVQLFGTRHASVWDPARVALTFDFPAPGVEVRVPRSRTICRQFVETHGLKQVYDLNLGIGAQVLLERGSVRPGQIVVGSGRCLHQLGAVGALVLGAEPGVLARVLATGLLPMKAPSVIQLRFEGTARNGFSAFDMGLLAGEALAPVSAEAVIEFTGTPVADLPIAGRITLVDIGAEAFRAGFIPADKATAEFYSERITASSGAAVEADLGAYTSTIAVPLAGREPLIQGPGPGGPIRPLSRLRGKKIHSAFIGSCSAGRHSDLIAVAGILKRAGKIHPDVRLTVAPTTLEVALKCVNSGIYETFLHVGAMVAIPGSSPGMAGGAALFGEGEVILSTVPYGSPMTDAGRGPEVYRASPATVAASVIAGEIRDPAEF